MSRVLNGTQYNRPTYRKRAEKIRQIAEELGHRPNLSTRAFNSGKFRAVTLLLSSIQNSSNVLQAMIYGITEAATVLTAVLRERLDVPSDLSIVS